MSERQVIILEVLSGRAKPITRIQMVSLSGDRLRSGSFYGELYALQEQGFVSSVKKRSDRLRKYTITDAGREALQAHQALDPGMTPAAT